MKKHLRVLTSTALSLAMIFSGTSSVSAAPVNHGKTLQATEDKTSSYVNGQALVMMKTSKKLSASSIKKKIGTGKDYSIANSWSFDNAELSVNKKGTFATASTDSDSAVTVALVKSDKLSTSDLVNKLRQDDDILYAEPNYKVKAFDVNDSYYNYQWGLDNKGQNGGIAGKSVNAPSKWEKGTTGSEKIVAIVDTGVNYKHEDLKDNLWVNTHQPTLKGEYGFDFANNDNDPLDDNGHGSHCAGIIGAKGNNGVGISGVNQNVKIMALKFLDDDGSGDTAGAIGAYHYINKALKLKENIVAINNSWGGGESSDILEKLIDIVGSKGAVSVCAAGNESENNDESPSFPANIDSSYVVSVAAVNEKNELATFSNYGKKTVDIAAPGTDILSTVSYNCYNPSIYSDEKQAEVSAEYNNFDNGEMSGFGIPDPANVSGSDNTVPEKYSAELTSEHYFGNQEGKSLKLSFKNLDANSWGIVRIPYTLGDDVTEDTLPSFSMMLRTSAPKGSNGYLLITDVAKGSKIPTSLLELSFSMENNVMAVPFDGDDNSWNHMTFDSSAFLSSDAEKNAEEKERELVFIFLPAKAGDHTVYIDDFGMSKSGVADSFGQYDFYSGTSMATPFVSGAIALNASELAQAGESLASETLINSILSTVDESGNLADKVSSGGSLDMLKVSKPNPRIGAVTVDTKKHQIKIKGSNFGSSPAVKIITADNQEHAAEILSSSEREIILKDTDFINRTVTLEITGADNKTVTKENIYLVKGKKQFTEIENFDGTISNSVFATDGKALYLANSNTDTFYMSNTDGKTYLNFSDLVQIDAKKYFKKDKDSLADYDLTFGTQLVYLDNNFYNIVAYSEVTEASDAYEDDEEAKDLFDDLFGDDEEEDENVDGFSSQYKLLAVSPSTGKIVDYGKLPSDFGRIEDYTLASYNGKLYLIGGYDYGSKELSTKVKVFDPSKKKWSNGPSLPEGRAGGYALQTGNSLVYTFGYGNDENCPANLILTGKTWKTSTASVTPSNGMKKINRSGKEYTWYKTSIGLYKNGLIYIGTTTDECSDTFIYDVSKDRFTGSDYTQNQDLSLSTRYVGLTLGNRLYAFDNEEYSAYKADIPSGLLKVTAPKSSKGKVMNANKSYLPGSKVTLTVKPKKGYGIKSFTIDGKKVSGSKTTIRVTADHKVNVVFVKGVSKIKLNKQSITLKPGKTFALKATVTPSKAGNKTITYKSSNEKYATVSSKGVIKAQKAGKGKTVTITATATDGTGVTAKCKVKIK